MNDRSLARELRRRIEGEVCFDEGSRALYATDASNYRQVPIGLVIPRSIGDVIQAVEICRKFGAPILSRGAGTSLAGQCCNVAVVLDMSKFLNRILEIDTNRRIARVEPGVILDDLRHAVRPHRLTFGPDPATHNRCTFGGMIGNNACGVHSVMAGKTVDNLEELEILTYDGLRLRVGKTADHRLKQIIGEGGREGEIYSQLKSLRDRYATLIRSRYPDIPRRVSGYNLDQLLPENGFDVARALAGTEGTCVMFLEATVKLVPDPPFRALLVTGYPDVCRAGDDVARILEHKPIGLEGLDDHYVRRMRKKGMHLPEISIFPDGESWLLIEFGGSTQEEAVSFARRLMTEIDRRGEVSVKLFSDPGDQKKIWAVRESTFGASVFVPGEKDTYAGFEDSAVPPAKLGDYLRDLAGLLKKYDYDSIAYGHFGDGCIHTRISFDLKSDSGIRKYRAFLEEAADLVIRFGGSLSGEHGDGQTWGVLLPKMFGPELVEAFREFKSIWDPAGKMNPGKVVDSFRPDENLRLHSFDTIPPVPLHFTFKEDAGNFARTTQRCIGIGKCLKKDEGTMCPSFMVTREEKHSTRGRAHLLFEMMRGEVIRGGWRDEFVKEALDGCLACKGCKSECPVDVDMATYKAEFLSHYYEGRLRPRSAYTLGLIHEWSSLASLLAGAVNGLMQTPGLRYLAKSSAGIALKRRIPSYATQTFKQWFRRRAIRNAGKSQVLLWPDTFNNYFHPQIARSAVEILEACGFQVTVPEQNLCCGRPLYDYGMLGLAKYRLRQILRALRPHLDRGVSFVGLEPSCVAVFRDELIQLFPDDAGARELSRRFLLLNEFLDKETRWNPPRLDKKAMVHGHCHQKSLIGMGHDRSLLAKMGLDFTILDSGCCGMAGAFGFEKDHYDISVKIGEQFLAPAVREADPETLIITDGFSCREQIAHLTGRQPLHSAELIRRALHPDA